MDLIYLSLIDLALFTGILIWEYVDYVQKKERFYSRLPSETDNSIPKTLLFLPSSLFFSAQKYFKRNQKKMLPKSISEEFTPKNLIIMNLAIALLAYNLTTLFKIPWYATILVGLLGQVLLYFFGKGNQKKVKEELEKKLPEILDIMARVYRVHTDLRVTLNEVADNISDAGVKEKFREMVRLSRFGYTVEEAMEHVAKDIKSDDFDFIVTSIKLNVPVGGDLSTLFEHTAKLIRQRKDAKNEIQNLMFQSKISSIISAMLVPVIIVVAFSSSVKYQQILLYNPTGRLVFFACLIWWIIGVVIIRKNSRIRI